MSIINQLLKKMKKIDFLFPNSFEQLMNDSYYDYDKFEWFLYHVFNMDESISVEKIGKKGQGDGGADLIITIPQIGGSVKRIGIQAKYWKNRVGTEPINQLASAKANHTLTDLWIITTSDLTPAAKLTAEKMNISVLRADDVKDFIEQIKDRHKKEIKEFGESSIQFIKEEAQKAKKSVENNEIELDENLINELKALRLEISKEYKLYPIYNVFNNQTLNDLSLQKPTTFEQLYKVKGFGQGKVEKFGQKVIDFFLINIDENKKELDYDKKLYDLLIAERVKISKYNKLPLLDCYDDRVARYLSKMKPRNKEELSKIYGFKDENIQLFGDYLLKVINNYENSNN